MVSLNKSLSIPDIVCQYVRDAQCTPTCRLRGMLLKTAIIKGKGHQVQPMTIEDSNADAIAFTDRSEGIQRVKERRKRRSMVNHSSGSGSQGAENIKSKDDLYDL